MTKWSRIGRILQWSALAVVVVACAGPVATGTTAPSRTPVAATPSPTPLAATPSPAPPSAAALPPGGGILEPGTYTTLFSGYRWTFTVQGQNWESGANPSERIFIGKASEADPQYFAGLLVYGRITSLVSDACQWQDAGVYPGTSADDYASALAAIEGFETSAPVDIDVSGYHGKLVRLTVPADVDIEACDNGEYHSFEGRFDYDPGQVEEVRIVDLDGVGYLYFTVVQVGTPADVMAELEQMVDSLEIEPAS